MPTLPKRASAEGKAADDLSAASDSTAMSPEAEELYRGFDKERLIPLWTQIDDLMPTSPKSRAVPYLWSWDALLPLARRAGELVPVGRGGERRAMALANPGLDGLPYATPTLWAAIQYLGPGEVAPEHRHTQNAFRFVIEGEGVWTLVNGDPIAMRRGDFLPQAGWNWHSHHNPGDAPMAWLDGLDIPFQRYVESTFFEFGPDVLEDRSTPAQSRSERLWAYPGLRPVSVSDTTGSTPLLAYRWEHTDAALAAQLELEEEGHPGVLEPGHAAVRFVSPLTGEDVLHSIRAEFHRLRCSAQTAVRREVGSSVYQVFDGSGVAIVGVNRWEIKRGDVFVVPSWAPFSVVADSDQASDSGGLDLFRFSDSPIFEALGAAKTQTEARK